jgi:hypothetical protein
MQSDSSNFRIDEIHVNTCFEHRQRKTSTLVEWMNNYLLNLDTYP